MLATPLAVAAARAKRVSGVEVWHLVNHSALRPGRGQGRVFRMALWPDLARAVTAGVDVRLRASHWRVHGLYLRELHELGLTLQRAGAAEDRGGEHVLAVWIRQAEAALQRLEPHHDRIGKPPHHL
ncbi:hypothetical protein O159_09740 [Leifsonia xyli subsp. cynodontis DSM 46306]|uniref:Uncharacterized protein n=1 Tax=Leifsonia xyli subsp. cynodontis DSM 46306 TaxID=1389489 RepID=U3P453_LEIXC|nr:hypothetical protein [Leifsonia xyli]AGW41095.1 hypothetical protein O159_09740 [Leifsonia xyli subsp. cynodontis DSM 46306]